MRCKTDYTTLVNCYVQVENCNLNIMSNRIFHDRTCFNRENRYILMCREKSKGDI